MRKLPNRLQGNSPMERAHNEVVAYLQSLRPLDSAGVVTQHTANGVSRKAVAPLPQVADNDFFPFKVYNFPSQLRIYQNSDDWRRVKVRSYRKLFNGSNSNDYGTDKAEDPWIDEVLTGSEIPPSDSATVNGTWHEVVVPLWPDGTTFAPVIFYSSVLPITGESGITDNSSRNGVCLGKLSDNGLTMVTTIIETGETFNDTLNIWDSPYHKTLAVLSAVDATKTLTISQQAADIQGITDFRLFQPDPFSGPTIFQPYAPDQRQTRFRGIYSASCSYWYGDIVYDDRSETTAFGDTGTHTYRYLSCYLANDNSASSYAPSTLRGPMNGVAPSAHSPDPWFTLSRSKIA